MCWDVCQPLRPSWEGKQHKQFQCQLITLEDTVVVVVSKHKIDGDAERCLRTW